MRSGWQRTTLQDVTLDVETWDPSTTPAFTYVDISSIDNVRCEIANPRRIPGSQAPSRARQRIQDGDVLFSNVRTYLRNVAQVQGLEVPAVASTGFTVLRPSASVDSRFLYHLVRSDLFINQVTPEQTGTHYPAATGRIVKGQTIELPGLDEQRAIATLLDDAERSRRSAASHLAAAARAVELLRQAILATACSGRLTADWRGDHEPEPAEIALQARRRAERLRLGRRYREPFQPETDKLPDIPSGWTWSALPELGELARGKSRHRPRNDPMLFGGSYPFIQTGDVARSGGRITHHSQAYNEVGLAQSRLWPEQTVCITIAANIAESGLLTYPAAFPDSVVGLIADENVALPEYVELFVRTARRDLAAFAPATAQANINLAILAEVAVALPPIEEQSEIVRRAGELFAVADTVINRLDAAARAVGASSRAIVARAFSGELLPNGASMNGSAST